MNPLRYAVVLCLVILPIAPAGSAQTPPVVPEMGLITLGFSPQNLAAANASAQDVEALLAAANVSESELANHRAVCEALQAAVIAMNETNTQIAMTGSTANLEAERAARMAALSTERATHAGSLVATRQLFLDALEARLTAPELSVLAQLIENDKRAVPTRYKVLDLTDADWTTLRSALTKSSAGNQALTPAESQVLTAANTNPDVVLATQRLQQNLPAIEQAFNTAIAQSFQAP